MDVKKSANLTGRIFPLLQSCFQALINTIAHRQIFASIPCLPQLIGHGRVFVFFGAWTSGRRVVAAH